MGSGSLGAPTGLGSLESMQGDGRGPSCSLMSESRRARRCSKSGSWFKSFSVCLKLQDQQ
jgi:hypothetical protein